MSAVDLDALIAELRTPIRVQYEEKPNHVLRRANVSRLNAAKALEDLRRAPVSAGKVKALAEKLRAELVDHGYQDEGKMVRLCDRILSALQPGDGWQGIESAATALLNDKAAFARMVDAAEEIHETGVSFNVVIGDALRAASLPQGEETR